VSREQLRQTFGEDAELYDRVRPTYPPLLFEDLARLVGERPNVLEIGPGTGQATAAEDDVPEDSAGLRASGVFGAVEFRRYVRDLDYSAAEYVELLSSYSGHRALTMQRRDRLYDCVRALIEASGGSVTKRYLNQLSVGISLNQPLA
jgi:hypothetical protein